MKFRKNWIIGFLVSIAVDIAFNFAYGFIIGGKINAIYCLSNIVLVILTMATVFKFRFSEKSDIAVVIFTIIVSLCLNVSTYDFLNKVTADKSTEYSYETVAYDCECTRGNPYQIAYFRNSDGEDVSADVTNLGEFFYYYDLMEDLGGKIKVTEIMGGFHYKYYNVEAIIKE